MGLFDFSKTLLSKTKGSSASVRFSYSFTVHSLQPWPTGNKAIAIGWQRGQDRRGATSSVYPSLSPAGKAGTIVRFNEKFEVPVTLYKAGGSPSPGVALGPFKKKCLILAVLETDGLTQATAALGRVVIDLSEYAAADAQDIRTFQVACSKAVQAAVGDPQLTVSIRCRVHKSSRPGHRRAHSASLNGGSVDDAVSNPSTADTTGSRLTANLSSFLRFRHAKAQNAEQDLNGFDGPKLRDVAAAAAMERIGEEGEAHDEGKAGVPGRVARAVKAASARPAYGESTPTNIGTPPSLRRMATPPGKLPATPGASARSREDASTARSREDDGADNARQGSSNTPSSLHSSLARLALASSADTHVVVAMRPSPSSGKDMCLDSAASQDTGSLCSARGSALQLHGGHDALQLLLTELLGVAAMEVCVHLAAHSVMSGRDPARSVHAPARRLVRTLVSLGPDEAVVLGMQALRLIGAQMKAAAGEMNTLVMWWSNVTHMRALLQGIAMGQRITSTGVSWVSKLVLELQGLEKVLYDELLALLWDGSLLPPVLAAAAASGTKTGTPSVRRVVQEAALKRWFEGLEAVFGRLVRLGRCGHVALLRQQLMRQCLTRVDALLFFHLLSGEDVPTAPAAGDGDDPRSSLWAGAGGGGDAPPPLLEDSALPFSKGALSFGGGMSVKMTVTRLQQWATSEALCCEVWERASGQDQGGGAASVGHLFPLLRAAADLLMMPKELLMDRSIRQDVSNQLGMRCVMYMMTKFAADEFAHEAVGREVLDALEDEQLLGGAALRTDLATLPAPYRQPDDDVLLRKVECGSEPGVEYDDESETELEAVGQLAAGPRLGQVGALGSGSTTLRFRLLHDLWAAGVPRQRHTVTASK